MSQNASNTWNQFALNYRFLQTTNHDVTEETTFGEAYSGANFAGDFNAILGKVDQILRPHAATPPAYGEDDLMLGSLENYPDDPV